MGEVSCTRLHQKLWVDPDPPPPGDAQRVTEVRFSCEASRQRSDTTPPLGWRWGKVSHFGSLGEPHV